MTIIMDNEQITTLEQVQKILESSQAIAFEGSWPGTALPLDLWTLPSLRLVV